MKRIKCFFGFHNYQEYWKGIGYMFANPKPVDATKYRCSICGKETLNFHYWKAK